MNKPHLYRHLIFEKPEHGIIWYPRFFFKLYPRDPDLDLHRETRALAGGHVEFVLRKPNGEFGLSFEVGTRGSETPFDGHIKIAGTACYWGLENGGTLAQKITQFWFNRLPNRLAPACYIDDCDCPAYNPGATFKRHIGRNGQEYEHQYDGRELKFFTYGDHLYWALWTPKNGSSTKGFARWRTRSIKLNPLDYILGEAKYSYEDVETRPIMVELPELSYPVQATLRRQYHGRPKGRRLQTWGVDVDAKECKGIPYRHDHSGGYKGDRVWGFGVKLKGEQPRKDWHIDAKAAIEAYILQRRADTHFRKALPLEEAGSRDYTC